MKRQKRALKRGTNNKPEKELRVLKDYLPEKEEPKREYSNIKLYLAFHKCSHHRNKLIYLDHEYQYWSDKVHENAPRGGWIPAGGGEWMDSFFRAEGIRGVQNALRAGKDLDEAIEEGKIVSEIAIELWNKHREYQVHRWEKTCHSFLERIKGHLICLN